LNKQKLYTHIENLIFHNEIPRIELKEWEDIVHTLREVNLLAACYFQLEKEDKLKALPLFAFKHMKSAAIYSSRQSEQVIFECKLLQKILDDNNISSVFLKGASYTLRKSNNSQGRVYSDIDLLVAKNDISKAEKSLEKHAWCTKKVSEYDNKYYREWSHEIPPMFHIHRGTVLDLHHNILLPISGRKVNVDVLTENCQLIDGSYTVLSYSTTILHSIVHLIINEDVSNGYRDILDITTLIKERNSAEFWQEITLLSSKLGFNDELYLALSLSNKYANLTIPNEVWLTLNQQKNNSKLNFLLNHVYYYALQPHSPAIQTLKHKVAITVVYFLGHLQKMPLKILIPHLLTKSFFSIRDQIFGKHHFDK
jgi:hypothetical protein